jgi:GR25 family glycosyltransferase involved in LPS biosynthesis
MYQGFFINLRANDDRRQSLVQRLEQIGAGARYQRFEAVDGRAVAEQYDTQLDPGALGAWLSHEKLLASQRSGRVHLHIIEDDVVFAKNAVDHFQSMLSYADQTLPWDLIFTDILTRLDTHVFRAFEKKMTQHQETGFCSLVPLEGISFGSMCSYFVNRHSVGKVVDLISGKWAAGLPIDLHVRDLIGQRALQAYTVLPFLTCLSPHNVTSNIRGDYNLSHAVADLYRRAFFIDADLHLLLQELEELIKGVHVSPLRSLYLKTLWFMWSDQCVQF